MTISGNWQKTCSPTTNWPGCGGPGTSRWWNGRSGPSRGRVARPAHRTCASVCRCGSTRSCGSCGIISSEPPGRAAPGGRFTKKWGSQMLDSTDEESQGLLAEAARQAEGMGEAADGVGDLGSYLEAYYRHVAAEDLVSAGPSRLAAVAVEHARLAAVRPQGRALVQVSGAGTCMALEGPRAVIDIVTDDKPFLVDSITMELARQGLNSYQIIHPQLLVRRDLTGVLH